MAGGSREVYMAINGNVSDNVVLGIFLTVATTADHMYPHCVDIYTLAICSQQFKMLH